MVARGDPAPARVRVILRGPNVERATSREAPTTTALATSGVRVERRAKEFRAEARRVDGDGVVGVEMHDAVRRVGVERVLRRRPIRAASDDVVAQHRRRQRAR